MVVDLSNKERDYYSTWSLSPLFFNSLSNDQFSFQIRDFLSNIIQKHNNLVHIIIMYVWHNRKIHELLNNYIITQTTH